MLNARPLTQASGIDVPTHTILNTKTPGRRALKGRSALQENAIHSGSKTVFSKKTLRTPFRPGTAHGKKPTVSVTRPLVDKTPFPNRVAAVNLGGLQKTPGVKLSKLGLLVPEPEQESTSPDAAPLLRPSSTRKSLRARISGDFKTPLTKGDYWNVSPGDIDGIGTEIENAKIEAVAAVVDDDEIEYMPPTAIDVPYEPPFEMPDYTVLGRGLFQLGHGRLMDDTADVYYAADIEQQIDVKSLLSSTGFTVDASHLDRLELPELEDDSPFPNKPPAPASMPAGIKSALTRTASTRTTSIPTRSTERPAPNVPQTQIRSAARTAPSAIPAASLAPGQTRTSAMRAAKAAAAGSAAPKSNSLRPTSAGARPVAVPPAKRLASSTSVARLKPLVRSATTGGTARSALATFVSATHAPSLPARSRSTSSSSPAIASSRSRSGTTTTKMGKLAAKKETVSPEDGLAMMLGRDYVAEDLEDFLFDV